LIANRLGLFSSALFFFFEVSCLCFHCNLWQDHRYTPLHLAVLYDHLEMVQYLIKEGANVNVKDEVNISVPCMLFTPFKLF